MIQIDIVCPLCGGYKYIKQLYTSFFEQENVEVKNIVLPLTKSDAEDDAKTIEFAKEHQLILFEIEKEDFSHSMTRQKAMMDYCQSDIVVMISQDIRLCNTLVFYNLVKSIDEKKTVYNYARQICTNRSIEKYIRKKNYPEQSSIISKDDIEKMQLMAFFASDACSAYDRNVFIELGGYGGYDVMMNEDQLYSKILLEAGYKKAYCADALVEHSHKYTLKQLYKRYYETGVFYAKVKVFDDYKSTNTGMKLAFYVLGQALMHFDIPVLFRWMPDMSARYFGMKKGKKRGGR